MKSGQLMRMIATLHDGLGWTAFRTFRASERVLGPAGLRLAGWPVAFLTAVLELPRWRKVKSPALSLSSFLGARIRFHLTRVLLTFPDRLAEPRWRNRGTLEGESHLKAALATGRPIILAGLHFGGHLILRYWLRAQGLPVATLVKERLADRSTLKCHKDSLSQPTEVPNVFSGHFPRDAVKFLRNHGTLIVMLDHSQGRLIDVPVTGETWRISTTAFRLAASSGAIVLPALLRETTPWRFTIHIGKAVPDGLLVEASNFPAAAQHLWREYLPVLRLNPGDWSGELHTSLRSTGPSLSPRTA